MQRVLLVDPDLRSADEPAPSVLFGHAAAAAGIPAVVLAHAACRAGTDGPLRVMPRSDATVLPAGPQDDLVFPRGLDAAGLARLLHRTAATPAGRRPTVRLIQSADPDSFPCGEQARWTSALGCLRGLAGGRILFHADTDALAERWRSFAGLPVAVCPRPLPLRHLPFPDAGGPGPGPVRLLFAGSADAKGGFTLLPDLVDALWLSVIDAGRAVLTILAELPPVPAPEVRAALDRLLAYPRNRVTVLTGRPSPLWRYTHLAEADLLLLPDPPQAARRTAPAPFIEAAALGKPMVLAAGTWMADRAGDGAVRADRADRFADAVRRALGRLPELTAAARANAPGWRRAHDPQEALRHLLQDRAPRLDGGAAPAALVVGRTASLDPLGAAPLRQRIALLARGGWRLYGVFVGADDAPVDAIADAFPFAACWRVGDDAAKRRIRFGITGAGWPRGMAAELAAADIRLVLTDDADAGALLGRLGLADRARVVEAGAFHRYDPAVHGDAAAYRTFIDRDAGRLRASAAVLVTEPEHGAFLRQKIVEVPFLALPPVDPPAPAGWDLLADGADLGTLLRDCGWTGEGDPCGPLVLAVNDGAAGTPAGLRWFLESVVAGHLGGRALSVVLVNVAEAPGPADDRVLCIARPSRPERLYAAARLVVVPCAGGVAVAPALLRALAYGRPVVATPGAFAAADPPPDIAGTDDPAAFAGRMLDLLHNPVRCRRVADAGLHWACRRLDRERAATAFAALAATLVSGAPPAPAGPADTPAAAEPAGPLPAWHPVLVPYRQALSAFAAGIDAPEAARALCAALPDPQAADACRAVHDLLRAPGSDWWRNVSLPGFEPFVDIAIAPVVPDRQRLHAAARPASTGETSWVPHLLDEQIDRWLADRPADRRHVDAIIRSLEVPERADALEAMYAHRAAVAARSGAPALPPFEPFIARMVEDAWAPDAPGRTPLPLPLRRIIAGEGNLPGTAALRTAIRCRVAGEPIPPAAAADLIAAVGEPRHADVLARVYDHERITQGYGLPRERRLPDFERFVDGVAAAAAGPPRHAA